MHYSGYIVYKKESEIFEFFFTSPDYKIRKFHKQTVSKVLQD